MSRIYTSGMKSNSTTSPLEIQVIPASLDQAPILANLLELYAYDFSDILKLRLGPDGRFGYDQLPLYWSDPDRHPFLIAVDDCWAGFALVSNGSKLAPNEDVWDMTEFFIMRSYRGKGIGAHVSHTVFERFPGKWEVRPLHRNEGSKTCWKR